MNDGEEWLLGPVEAGMCSYESLNDGTVDLFDLSRMNDYLAMKGENASRAARARNRAAEDKRSGR